MIPGFFANMEIYFAKIENQRHTLETLQKNQHIHLVNEFAKTENTYSMKLCFLGR